jgi:hypothetical protein
VPLAYVFDEHLRGPLGRAARQHNAAGVDPIDVVRIGDPPDLPLGTTDPDLLAWAEREQRILVTRDERSIPVHFANHLAAGRDSPGVFLLHSGFRIHDVLRFLIYATYHSHPDDWRDRIEYIP